MMLTKQEMQEIAQALQEGVNYHLVAYRHQLTLSGLWSTSYLAVNETRKYLPHKILQSLALLDTKSTEEFPFFSEERQAIRFMTIHFIALFLSTEEGPIDDEQLDFF